MTIKSIFILGLLNVCFGITVQATPVNFVAIPYSDINSLAKQLKTSRYSPFENPTGLYLPAHNGRCIHSEAVPTVRRPLDTSAASQ